MASYTMDLDSSEWVEAGTFTKTIWSVKYKGLIIGHIKALSCPTYQYNQPFRSIIGDVEDFRSHTRGEAFEYIRGRWEDRYNRTYTMNDFINYLSENFDPDTLVSKVGANFGHPMEDWVRAINITDNSNWLKGGVNIAKGEEIIIIN